MANYGFYPSVNGDRKYSADDFSRIFDGLITDGVYAGYGGNFNVSANRDSFSVTVDSGRAWLDHTWTCFDEVQTFNIPAASVSYPRIDSVAIQVNKNTRVNSIVYLTGTARSVPTAPTMANGTGANAGIYQHRLANIYVSANAHNSDGVVVSISVGPGGDTPFVTVIVDVNTPMSELMTQYTAQFIDWFSHLQNELDADQETHLQRQIDELANSFPLLVPGESITFSRLNLPARVANTNNRFVFNIPVGGSISSLVQDVNLYAETMTLYDTSSELIQGWNDFDSAQGLNVWGIAKYIEPSSVEMVLDYRSALVQFPKGLAWLYMENVTVTFS